MHLSGQILHRQQCGNALREGAGARASWRWIKGVGIVSTVKQYKIERRKCINCSKYHNNLKYEHNSEVDLAHALLKSVPLLNVQ